VEEGTALNGLTPYDRETGSRVSKIVCAALRGEVSEFRHGAVLLIAREQSWRISHELTQDAFQSLLRILKKERDMDSFLVSAFDRGAGRNTRMGATRASRKERQTTQNRSHDAYVVLWSLVEEAEKETEYYFAISFAGEDRKLAETLAEMLVLRGATVFYDDFEKADLWGKDLFQHLQRVYRDLARYCLVLISRHYTLKPWTKHELRQARERALKENTEYILPVRLDDADVPGVAGTTAYLDARNLKLDEIADLAVEKLHAEGYFCSLGNAIDRVLRKACQGNRDRSGVFRPLHARHVHYHGAVRRTYWGRPWTF
jgi:hypothetical protein